MITDARLAELVRLYEMTTPFTDDTAAALRELQNLRAAVGRTASDTFKAENPIGANWNTFDSFGGLKHVPTVSGPAPRLPILTQPWPCPSCGKFGCKDELWCRYWNSERGDFDAGAKP